MNVPETAPPRPLPRWAAYLRVSTAEQNVGSQRTALEKWASLHEVELTYFVDDGVSGTKTNRPALDEMMGRVEAGGFVGVVCFKLDRLGRSVRDLVTLSDKLKKRGLALASVSESINTDSPAGEMVFHVLAAMAQFERATIVERVRAGMAHARKNGTRSGKAIGRPRTLTEGQCETVREKRGEGWSYGDIAKLLQVSKSQVFRAARAAVLALVLVSSGAVPVRADDCTAGEALLRYQRCVSALIAGGSSAEAAATTCAVHLRGSG